MFRLPKFDYYFFQSQRSPAIHVAGLDDGPMVFIANFATFLSPTTVSAFSNCEEVRLCVDGREIGRKKPDAGWAIDHPPFSFEVDCFADEQSTMYMTGVAKVQKPPVEVVAEGMIGGKVVATHRVRPPGVARKLLLEADWCGRELVADGADWVRVHAKVCDAHGTVFPFGDERIEFSIEGNGRIIGVGKAVQAEAGIATVLVQAGKLPGKIKVKARSYGLESGGIEIVSVGLVK